MGRKRSNIEISVDILKVALEGAKKSRIVYRANLNFKMIKHFLTTLRESGLLTGPEGPQRLYHTTQKGREYITYFHGLQNYLTIQGN